MDESAKKIDRQIRLWPLLGPLLLTAVFFNVAIQASSHWWDLPLAGLIGIFTCYQWLWRGLGMACVLLLAVTLSHLAFMPTGAWMWPVVLSLSIASTFILSTLLFEESHEVWETFHRSVSTDKDTFAHLERQLKAVKYQLEKERSEWLSRTDSLQRELVKREEQQKSSEQLIGLAREEIGKVHQHQDKLLQ